MFFCHFLGAEDRAEQDVEEKSGVFLCLFGEHVLPLDDHQFLTELPHILHHFERMEVGLGACVNMEDFLCVPNQPAQVNRKSNLRKKLEIKLRTTCARCQCSPSL